MFTSNKWIAFWFASMVLNIATHSIEKGISGFFSMVGVVVAAWFFMAGFMEAIRPSPVAESENPGNGTPDEQPK
jgi:hypothetical protein